MTQADMAMRSYRQAAQIHQTVELVKPVLFDGVNTLGIIINTLEAARDFGGDMRGDLKSAISDTREDHTRLATRLEQLLTDLDVITRAISESSGLTRETRERLGVAAGHLAEGEEITADHLNLTSNVATLATGLEYLYSDPVYLKKTLAIAKEDVIREILTDMGWKVEGPTSPPRGYEAL